MDRALQPIGPPAKALALVLCLVAVSAASAVAQLSVKIEYTPNGVAGQMIAVPISLDNPAPARELGGFDLLVEYHDALYFQTADAGTLLTGCGWEYFTYRHEGDHLLRLIAMADINNGGSHPSCYAAASGRIARLVFMILHGVAQPGDFLPVKFWWYECGDNSLSDRQGHELFVSDSVYDFDGIEYTDYTADSELPSPHGVPSCCLTPEIERAVDFYNGGVHLVPVDLEPPVAICPGDIVRDNDPYQCGATVSWQASVTDNCPGAGIWCFPPANTFFQVGATEVMCIAIDTAGNRDTCTFTVTINDHEYPTIECPGYISVPTDAGQCGANVTYVPTAWDNCGVTELSCYPPSGSWFEAGSTQVVAIALDAGGRYDGCHFLVNVHDDEPPIAHAPDDIIVAAQSGQCGANVTFDISAEDNCAGVSVISMPPSGSGFAVGVSPVSVIATDASGNADTAVFSVTVLDEEPPVIVCPEDITVFNDSGSYGAVVSFLLEASDNCELAALTSTPVSGSFFGEGTSPVTVLAIDASGNVDTCRFDVTVLLDDPDSDGRPGWDDNCPIVSNADQADADSDGDGDVCDECTDLDGDGYGDPGFIANTCPQDNCPGVVNVDQADADSDGYGDVCDDCTDLDGDGYGDPGFTANSCLQDNCPGLFNTDQADADSDGYGDVCDDCSDLDGDGYGDPGFAANTCPQDNCPGVVNTDQADVDSDGYGDVCDDCTDLDGDGYGDPGFAANTCPQDNCPGLFNTDQADADSDGYGDVCDECTDIDNDGYGDPGFAANTCPQDNCPESYNPEQTDANSDGIGDACCCTGSVGNIDLSPDDLVTMGDFIMLIDHLFISYAALPCVFEANADLSPDPVITMGDMTVMIDYLFVSYEPLPACQEAR